MAKIGRNELCPCGSGKKFKRCCIDKGSSSAAQQAQPVQKVSVTEEIALIQDQAVQKNETLKNIGVFIFFSTAKGDAWLLELTAQDAVLLAKDGEKINIEIEESQETIEINWSHQFKVSRKEFTTTAYADKKVETHTGCPTHIINDLLKKIHKNYSSELLNSIHVDE